MQHQVEVWALTKPEKILDVMQILKEFGIAIAWIRSRILTGIRAGQEQVDIGLVLPFTSMAEYRAFNRVLFSISDSEEVKFGDGQSITTYDTPLSPYVPGDGGMIELKDCLFVPEGFKDD